MGGSLFARHARAPCGSASPHWSAEYNEEFEGKAREALEGAKEVVIACDIGGNFEPTHANPWGRQSRALIAAYALHIFGLDNGIKVKVLEGGMNDWVREGRETVVYEDDEE